MKNSRKKIILFTLILFLSSGCTYNNNISKDKKMKSVNIENVLSKNNLLKENYIVKYFNEKIERKNKLDELEKQKQEREKKIKNIKDECEETINLYASIYNIKPEIVKNIVSNYTDNFSSSNFIDNKSIIDGNIHYSFDYEIIMLVSDLNDNPEEYNYDYSSIKSENINDNLYDKTIREFIIRTSNALSIDPMLSLSISCAESYYFEASIATENCNPFALRYTSDFNTYDNIYQGILEGELCLKKGYIDQGATTLEAISKSYCGSSSQWVNLVNGVRNELENGRIIYDEVDNKTLTMKREK